MTGDLAHCTVEDAERRESARQIQVDEERQDSHGSGAPQRRCSLVEWQNGRLTGSTCDSVRGIRS